MTGFEPATSASRTQQQPDASDSAKGLAASLFARCTTGCTSEADLLQIAADLRDRLSADDCHRLAGAHRKTYVLQNVQVALAVGQPHLLGQAIDFDDRNGECRVAQIHR